MSMKKNVIKMTSKFGSEFDSEILIGEKRYLVQTESGGEKRPLIITRAYLNGQIMLTRKTDFGGIVDAPDVEKRVRELMQKQHDLAIRTLGEENIREKRSTSDYMGEVKELLRKKNKKSAIRVLHEAIDHYPDDPFLLSYYGCLEAVANKNYKSGIDTCHRAIESLKRKVPFGEEFLFPVFFLNLGRAYLAAGKKKEAVESFSRGLSADSENSDLLWEIKQLGVRRKPAVPFLKRSNPINKYIGQMLHSVKK
jgi:tetratricopeptide (TPR) repeat protein